MLDIKKLKILYKEKPERFRPVKTSDIKELEEGSVIIIPAFNWHHIIENNELCSTFLPTSTFSDLANTGYIGNFGNVSAFTDAFLDVDDPLSGTNTKLEGILALSGRHIIL
jgi:hypothetical protein